MKKLVNDIKKYLINSILAGVMIGVGGTVFLSLENKVVGAIFFAIGLFVIVTKSLNLFTGKVGYIFNNPPRYLIEVFVTLIGNFIGTFLVGFLLSFTRIYSAISEKAAGICEIKLNDGFGSVLILSIFCGMLMYLAVNGFKEGKDAFSKYASVFLGVIVFILCGFEHSIANMYYFSVANMWSPEAVLSVLVMILGNSIGGVIFPLCDKLKRTDRVKAVAETTAEVTPKIATRAATKTLTKPAAETATKITTKTVMKAATKTPSKKSPKRPHKKRK